MEAWAGSARVTDEDLKHFNSSTRLLLSVEGGRAIRLATLAHGQLSWRADSQVRLGWTFALPNATFEVIHLGVKGIVRKKPR